MSKALVNRAKSLAWRTSIMVLAVVLSFVADNAAELQIPPYVVVFIGLLGGELSKYINKK